MNWLYNVTSRAIPMVPMALRNWIRKHISLSEFDIYRRRQNCSFANMSGEDFKDSPVKLGIIHEICYSHRHYIAACRELHISYEVFDLLADDWITRFKNSGCDAFLVWPSSNSTTAKELFDYRLRILEKDLGKRIFPTWQECWLTEHKPRLRDWMDAHGVPHPKTWVAYRKSDALVLINQISYPVVGKSAIGASGRGVTILKTASELRRYINRLFGCGIPLRGFDPRDRHRGYLYLQEYLPDVQEWRMVRIGNSFFGHRKGTSTRGLHSGAKHCHWEDPGIEKLNMLKKLTDRFGFRSMDMDLFVLPGGRMLVNELQTTFGCSVATSQMKIDGVEGRYLYEQDMWLFKPGRFCQNHMCNLRIDWVLRNLSF